MNDEGATHYVGVIENMGLGHRLLNDTFGECGLPRIAWQVKGRGQLKKKTFSFGHCPNYLTPPP